MDRKTGDIVWRVERNDMAVNYSHPVICETPAGPELVVAGTGKLIGYDPHTGKQLWFARTLLRNIKTTPVCHDGVVYISLQSSGIANQWLATADQGDTGNNDGRLTKDEMRAFAGDVPIPDEFMQRFDRGDKNHDGFLEGEELDHAFLAADNFAGARHDAAEAAEQFILAVRGRRPRRRDRLARAVEARQPCARSRCLAVGRGRPHAGRQRRRHFQLL